MTIKELKVQVGAADAGRVDVLVARLIGFSRSRVRGLIGTGGVALNGLACADAGAPVAGEDWLTVRYDPERRYPEPPAARATHGFSVVYADEHLVVVNKEAGVLTVPTDRGEVTTLVTLLSTHLSQGQRRGPLVSVVHRLDRDTSGLLVFGRRPDVARSLIGQFEARKPEREYAAIVAGHVGADQGAMRSYLHTDKALNQKSGAHGELAVTHYRVTSRYPDATQVAVNLETGRRNQIRVHFSEAGHPVLGDVRYLPAKAAHRAWPYRRLALHARLLGFTHPIERRALRFEAPLPLEFLRFAATATAKTRA